MQLFDNESADYVPSNEIINIPPSSENANNQGGSNMNINNDD